MRVVWSDRAVADLTAIRDYIAQDSEANAASMVERLIVAAERLSIFPDRGRRVPEAPDLPDLRELIVDPYRLMYRRLGERVEVVMLIHGRRRLGTLEPLP